MLEFEWGKYQSSILLSAGPGDQDADDDVEPPSTHHHHHQHHQQQQKQEEDSDQTRQMFAHYNNHHQDLSPAGNLFPPTPPPPPPPNNSSFANYSSSSNHQQHPFFHHHHGHDPQAYALSYPHPHQPPPSFSPESIAGEASAGFMMMTRNEDIRGGGGIDYEASRIGLNLGVRTYFSSEEDDDLVNRLYRGGGGGQTNLMTMRVPNFLEPAGAPPPTNTPRCQAEGCKADLTHAKHYHRRHKVCEAHSKAATVLTSVGLTQRFCQQCSRFHPLDEFDLGKRSCRKRLADHNRRRRKSQPQQQRQQQSQQLESTNASRSSPSDNTAARSSPDSGAHSSATSVTVAVSPPPMSLGVYPPPTGGGGGGGGHHQASGSLSSSSMSSNSLFSPVGNFRPYERQMHSWDEQEEEDQH